jgi:subtilisin family serine protease
MLHQRHANLASLAVCLVTASIAVPSLVLQSQRRAAHGRQTVIVGGHEAVANEALVTLKPSADVNARDAIAASVEADEDEHVGGRVRRMHSKRFSAEVLLSYLRTVAAVETVEPNWIVHADAIPTDTKFPKLWAFRNTGQSVNNGPAGLTGADIRAASAWDLTTGSRANVVAIVDTGVDYTHPDLSSNIWSAPAAFTVTIGGVAVRCAAGTHGFNAIARTCNPMDDNNHGTHVAGTIGAQGNNAAGVTGVNWKASIMPLKFMDASGTGTTADAIAAIEFAIQAKAAFSASAAAKVRVLSNSWTGGGFSQALLDTINKAGANDMLFVAAAGNSSASLDTAPVYPASYDAANVIAVAATDNADQIASFSNFGSPVDLAAPGVNILSTGIGGGYWYASGTSMATPQVSGAAALVLSRCALATAALKTNLLSHVDVLGSLTGRVHTNGRLNVYRAVSACAATATVSSSVPAPPTHVSAVTGANAGEIKIAWTASAGAAYYKVKRSMLSTGPYSTIDTATGTSYVNKYLASGKTYYYLTTAVNASGQSADSNHTSAAAK